MKKYFFILTALSLGSTMALAQGIESDVDAELDQIYKGQKAAVVTEQTLNAPNLPVQHAASAGNSQPIYILNQAPSSATAQLQQAQTQVQKQPTTIIEASPLSVSRADEMRKARQETEVQTEQKIVEKLESSRMDDEKKRADVLFGDKFDHLNNQQKKDSVQPVIQVQQIPVQVLPIQQVTVEHQQEPKEKAHDVIHEELASAMKLEDNIADASSEMKYISASAGVADLPDARNVRGNYSLGVSLGNKYDGLILEGSFLFSNYSVDESANSYYGSYSSYSYGNNGYYLPLNVNVNQYSGQLLGKVQIFSGVIRPVFGAIASYSYRTFNWTNNYSGYTYNNGTNASSHALDFGALAGVDFVLNPKYSLGLDFRYMWNMASRVDANNTWMALPQYGTPIEKLQYYVMSVVGRVNF